MPSSKTNSKDTNKKTVKKQIKKPVKPKIDYKLKYKDAQELIKNLDKKIIELKKENESNMLAFQEKAKSFQSKAQIEINKVRVQINKHSQEEIEIAKKYSIQKLVEAITGPILNIDQAVKTSPDNEYIKPYVSGFNMLLNQLYQEMANYGISKITPNEGDSFDPELHYVISKKTKSGTKITKVKKDGFKLHDRVIMPATVEIG